MKKMKRVLSVLLILVLMFSNAVSAFASDKTELEKKIAVTAAYLQKIVKDPQISSIGGEWAVIGLARSSAEVPMTYFKTYYENVEKEIKEKKGILHSRKYTEYSRVSLALTAIGADPSDVGGYDLMEPLADYEKVTEQGINGPVWALIALNGTEEICQRYVDVIISKQLPDGGWNLSGNGSADPDVTGMVLQALANYKEQPAVKTAVEQALLCLSRLQDDTGGFSSYETNNSESIVQVIVALGELGIPLTDTRFVKEGNTLLDALLTYWNKDGSFSHTGDGESNLMATEQGFYGLVSAQRNLKGENSLYHMDDVLLTVGDKEDFSAEKQGDIEKTEVIAAGKTFVDIQGHEMQTEIEALASCGIISGMNEDSFVPDATMTRAQFASIVVRALGLPQKEADVFSDVKKGQWYWSAVGTAYNYGLVSGKTATVFDPNGTITRQEAASMVARAAKCCGMDTAMEEYEIQNTLTLFGDYPSVADWARESVAFCYKENILDKEDWNIEPVRKINRSEVAQMLYHLLKNADLL